MTTVLYRKSTGEVLNISSIDQPFTDADTVYFGVLTDPTLTDGTDVADANGDLKVLGFAKFADVVGDEVRNATQAEIDAFLPGEEADEAAMDTERAVSLADLDPIFRKVFRALLLRIMNEVFEQTNVKVNNMVDLWAQHKADIAAATSLANLQTRTAALPNLSANLKESVTLAQAIQALKNDIENAG